jgi:DnaJ-domain-containing protein 1
MGAVGCTNGRALRAALEGAAAAVVQVRVLAVPSMFPAELREAAEEIPFDVACLVASPQVLAEAGLPSAALGEALVFGRGQLLGRIEAEMPDPGTRLRGLLGAGVAPFLTHEESVQPQDPFDVIGVGRSASFDEVHDAWVRRLEEYHPDRYARAGEKIRRLAATETQRLNAAYAALMRGRTR